MSDALTIASHITMSYRRIKAVKKLGMADTESPMLMFYAAENLVMATLESEGIPRSVWKSKAGNHQLSRMIDCLPDDCYMKNKLSELSSLTAFATTFRYPDSSGNIPEMPDNKDMEKWLGALISLYNDYSRHFKVNAQDKKPVALSINPFRLDPEDTLGTGYTA